MQPTSFEEIRLVRCRVKWEPRVKTWIMESREEVVDEARCARCEVQVYTDGSGMDGGVVVVAVCSGTGRSNKH